MTLAREAMKTLPEDGKTKPPYTTVKQGQNEAYMAFLDHLRDVLQWSELTNPLHDALFMSLAAENANFAC